ncbi:PD-(D/E)XK nuclease domain protein [Campylobacter showae]|uniref:PD-(D/E)XK nuclease superfamily protein n=2 Tax=Campylobacter TaxID=194 RepID=C6REA8_9BACT|nr:PD-(D/E)XK nuclease family protein [Campylobacter showae]EET80284.1 hypothetical protein CAMSH0001_2000 [Campylobacter showae RM3277]QCD48275.1 PD-(D/E)XK nuclease domain protein [Campylobacter showae]
MAKNDLEILKEFINDKEAQEKFNAIKNSVMDFNIFEITGLGNQEIKHSNTLAWLFGDNEHGLKYQILEGFLKFTLENGNNTSESYENLEKYLKIQEKNIRIFRESDNIDLLLIDENSKFVITIENKVEADESEKQLPRYRKFIDNKFKKFKRIYIFLTKDGRLPEDETEQDWWLVATYKIIGDSIEYLLKNNNPPQKANIILSSYVDLLKRKNIMSNEKLQNLCEQIWDKYEKELQILISYKRTKLDKLFEAIKNTLEERGIEIYKDSRLNNLYLIRTKNADYIYNFMYSKNAKEANKERKYAIDIQFNITKEEYIWIGYDGSYKQDKNKNKNKNKDSAIEEHNKKIDKLSKILNININKNKGKEIYKINKSEIENFNDEDIETKAKEIVKKILVEIEEFDIKIITVSSELGNS